MELRETQYLSHSQTCVCNYGMSAPHNSWKPENLAQGFSCRTGTVSFYLTFEAGECLVEISYDVSSKEIRDAAVRVIQVPFVVQGGRGVEIISTVDGDGMGIRVPLSDGNYGLVYEGFADADDEQKVRLSFYSDVSADYKIIRSDDKITEPDVFLLDSAPA
jgi:hypothetical protein